MTVFFRCFHFSALSFTTVFWVFSLLISIVHVTNFLYPDYFFAAFLLSTLFLCCCTANATDLRELFLLSGNFYLTLLPDIWHNLLLSRLPLEPEVLPWRFQGLPLRFETQTRPICLFELNKVQQKVLVYRFYLCVRSRNTISTYSLIVTYTVKCMSYPLEHRSS